MKEMACPGCGGTFTTVGRQKFCKRRCQARMWQRDRLGIADPGFVRSCRWCNESFEFLDARQYYCKEDCSRIGALLYNIKRLYGVTFQEYRTAYFAQEGLCAICRRPEQTERNTMLAVDHDHVTDSFRGLLCSNCNRAAGLFGDDSDVMRAAAEYVERYRAKVVNA